MNNYLLSKFNELFNKLAHKNFSKQNFKGFTLIEMMVAVSIFAMVMVMAVGALLSIVDASRESTSQQSAFVNLDFAMDSISRMARVGSTYRCIPGAYTNSNISVAQDCPTGGSAFAFEPFGGSRSNPNDQVVFRLNGTQIERSTTGGGAGSFLPVTSGDVTIQNLTFFVRGSTSGDSVQPLVLITVSGYAGTSTRSRVFFNLQTVASQRLLDI